MQVQERLIREAQLLTTGAEIHTTRELIAMYRGAAKSDHAEAFLYHQNALDDHIAALRVKPSNGLNVAHVIDVVDRPVSKTGN